MPAAARSRSSAIGFAHRPARHAGQGQAEFDATVVRQVARLRAAAVQLGDEADHEQSEPQVWRVATAAEVALRKSRLVF